MRGHVDHNLMCQICRFRPGIRVYVDLTTRFSSRRTLRYGQIMGMTDLGYVLVRYDSGIQVNVTPDCVHYAGSTYYPAQ